MNTLSDITSEANVYHEFCWAVNLIEEDFENDANDFLEIFFDIQFLL